MPDLGPLGTKIIGKTPEGRPIILNPDLSYSTERTITVNDPGINNGLWTNIPTMYGGKAVSPEMAIMLIRKHNGIDPDTGKQLLGYKSEEEAVKEAEKRSAELDKLLTPMLRPILKKYGAE